MIHHKLQKYNTACTNRHLESIWRGLKCWVDKQTWHRYTTVHTNNPQPIQIHCCPGPLRWSRVRWVQHTACGALVLAHDPTSSGVLELTEWAIALCRWSRWNTAGHATNNGRTIEKNGWRWTDFKWTDLTTMWYTLWPITDRNFVKLLEPFPWGAWTHKQTQTQPFRSFGVLFLKHVLTSWRRTEPRVKTTGILSALQANHGHKPAEIYVSYIRHHPSGARSSQAVSQNHRLKFALQGGKHIQWLLLNDGPICGMGPG